VPLVIRAAAVAIVLDVVGAHPSFDRHFHPT